MPRILAEAESLYDFKVDGAVQAENSSPQQPIEAHPALSFNHLYCQYNSFYDLPIEMTKFIIVFQLAATEGPVTYWQRSYMSVSMLIFNIQDKQYY